MVASTFAQKDLSRVKLYKVAVIGRANLGTVATVDRIFGMVIFFDCIVWRHQQDPRQQE